LITSNSFAASAALAEVCALLDVFQVVVSAAAAVAVIIDVNLDKS